MYKELIITVMIVILIFSIDIISNNYTSQAANNLSEELKILKQEIEEKGTNKADDKVEEIFKKWNDYYNVMAYYIEHDELEKVETELTKLKADIKSKKYEDCINEIDTTIFILKHIENKEKFTLQSIF